MASTSFDPLTAEAALAQALVERRLFSDDGDPDPPWWRRVIQGIQRGAAPGAEAIARQEAGRRETERRAAEGGGLVDRAATEFMSELANVPAGVATLGSRLPGRVGELGADLAENIVAMQREAAERIGPAETLPEKVAGGIGKGAGLVAPVAVPFAAGARAAASLPRAAQLAAGLAAEAPVAFAQGVGRAAESEDPIREGLVEAGTGAALGAAVPVAGQALRPVVTRGAQAAGRALGGAAEEVVGLPRFRGRLMACERCSRLPFSLIC